MSGFSFDATAGTSQSTTKPRLAGNNIYDVKLDGTEIQDIQGVKEPTAIYKVLKIKFSNDEGSFEHTVFEPKPDDFKRTESEFKNKNGNTEKIPQPSNVESMMLLFKHIIDGFVPEVAALIDKKEKTLAAKDWDALRKLVASILEKGKDRTDKIKLITNNAGEAKFPGYFAGLSREGVCYVRNNFVGPKVAFSAYEITKMTASSTAKITPVEDFIPETPQDTQDNGLDLDFEIGLGN